MQALLQRLLRLGLPTLSAFFPLLLLQAQDYQLQSHWWQPNGNVSAIVRDTIQHKVYIGGSFTQLGPTVPFGIPISTSTAQADFNFATPNGIVRASVPDGNGGWYIGGDFTRVGDSLRSGIAHLAPNGQVSTLFHGQGFNSFSSVNALLLESGTLYAGGSFTSFGSQQRRGAVCISPSGSPLIGNMPNSGVSNAIADGNGGWYICGGFSTIGDSARLRVAHINNTGQPTPWSIQGQTFDSYGISALAISGDTLFIGGYEFGGGSAPVMAVSRTSGAVIWSNWIAASDGGVFCMSLVGGRLIIGGYFDDKILTLSSNTGSILPWPCTVSNTFTGGVRALAVYGGTLIIGGYFEMVNSIPRTNFAAVNLLTGSLLPWNPNPNLDVTCMKLQGNTLYVGGFFTTIASQSRSRLAAFDLVTQTLTPWSAAGSITGSVNSMELMPNALHLGGDFTSINGQARNRVAALELATANVLPWNPNASARIDCMAASGSNIYIGSTLNTIIGGTTTRNRLAAFEAGTGVLKNWNPNANGSVNALSYQDGQIYFGGSFTSVSSIGRNRLAAVDTLTANLNPAFNPSPNGAVNALVIQSNTLWFGGSFTQVGGIPRERFAGVDLVGTLLGISISFNNTVNAITALPSGRIFIGGNFTQANGQARNRIAVFTQAGGLLALNPGANGNVFSLNQRAGLVYVGGAFDSIAGQIRNRVALLDGNSGNALAWNPNAGSTVRCISPEAGGAWVYVGGDFLSISGLTRNRLACIDARTGQPTLWAPSVSGYSGGTDVYTLLLNNNILYFGGNFTQVNGQARNFVAAVDTLGTGNLLNWNPNADHTVWDLKLGNNVIYAGGAFTNIGGQARNYLAGLSPGGTGTATAWNPSASFWVTALSVSGNTVYAGGQFTNIGGQARQRIAALNANTGLADSWDPSASCEPFSILPIGASVFVGGCFSTLGGLSRSGLGSIDLSTGIASGWNPSANGNVVRLARMNDELHAVGNFNFIGGQARYRVAVFSLSSGSLQTWHPQVITGGVGALELNRNIVHYGGNFLGVGGQAQHRNLAVFCKDNPGDTAFANTVCAGQNLQLNAGPSGQFYTWEGPLGFNASTATPNIPNANIGMSGIYRVTVTKPDGCRVVRSTNVTVNPSPTVSITGVTNLCAGQSSTLTASGASNYIWNTGATTTSIVVSPSTNTTYTVSGTLGNCSASTMTVVNINPQANATQLSGSNCLGDVLLLSTPSVVGATYQWSGPMGFNSISQVPSRLLNDINMAGTYTVTVTAGGCTRSSSTNVIINNSPTVAASNTGPYCSGQNISLSASSLSGATYSWSGPSGFSASIPAPTLFNANAAMAGIYQVVVTANNGCRSTVTTEVIVSDTLGFSLEPVAVGQTNLQPDSARAWINPSDYNNPARFSLSYPNGSFNPSLTGLGQQAILVNMIDNSTGCGRSGFARINVIPNPVFQGLEPFYCASSANQNDYILRDTANYRYEDTVLGVFYNGSPLLGNVTIVRIQRNRMSYTASNYTGPMPNMPDADSLAFLPAGIGVGGSVIQLRYRTRIQWLNTLGQVTRQYEYTVGEVSYTVNTRPANLLAVQFSPIAESRPATSLDQMLQSANVDSLFLPSSAYLREYFAPLHVNTFLGVFDPSSAGLGTHSLQVRLTDTLNGCVEEVASQIEVIADPRALGLQSQYCGNAALTQILRDPLYPYQDTVLYAFQTGLAAPNSLYSVRLIRNMMEVTASNYSGIFPLTPGANSFDFNPMFITGGSSQVQIIYRTRIEWRNVLNQVQLVREYISGDTLKTVNYGAAPLVNIQLPDTLLCPYNEFRQLSLFPAPLSSDSVNLSIRNLRNQTNRVLGFTSTGEVFINPATLDSTANLDTDYRLYYSVLQNGCLSTDSLTVFVPQRPDAFFAVGNPDSLRYCVSDAPLTLFANTSPGGHILSAANGGTRYFINGLPATASFAPSAWGVGTHQLRYELRDIFGCVTGLTRQVRVNALPTPTVSVPLPAYCNHNAIVVNPSNIQVNFTPLPSMQTQGVLEQLVGANVSTLPSLNSPQLVNPDNLLPASATAPITVIYRYTFTDSLGCSDSAQVSTVVNPRPSIFFTDLPLENCRDLSLSLPLNVSPSGVNINIVDLNNAPIPSANFNLVSRVFTPVSATATGQPEIVRYSYIDPVTTCQNIRRDTVEVRADSLSFSFAAIQPSFFCQSDSSPVPLQVSVTGPNPVLTQRRFESSRAYNPSTGSNRLIDSLTAPFSGGMEQSNFIPALSDTGWVTLTYRARTQSGCTQTAATQVYVHRPTPIGISFVNALNGDSICEDASSVIFIQNYPVLNNPITPRIDSIWSVNPFSNLGVQNISSIRYDFLPAAIPSAQRLGWHQIRVRIVDNYGCRVEALDSLKVISNPRPSIIGLNAQYCQDSTGVLSYEVLALPQGGNWYNLYDGTRYYFSDLAGQPSLRNFFDSSVLVDGGGRDSTLNLVPNYIKRLSGQNFFYPTDTGVLEVLYQFRHPNSCMSVDTFRLVVRGRPNLQVADTTVCSNSAPFVLRARANGQLVRSTHFLDAAAAAAVQQDSVFNPALALFATPFNDRTIVATYQDPNSGCSDTTSFNIRVNRSPQPALQGLSSSYCTGTTQPTPITGLNNEPNVPSGTGFFYSLQGGTPPTLGSTALFTPANVSAPADTLVFRFTNSLGCTDSVVRIVGISGLPTGLLVSLNRNGLCENEVNIPATGFPSSQGPNSRADFIVLSPSLQPVDSNSTNNINLQPALYAPQHGLGQYRLVYRYRDNNGCESTDTSLFRVHPKPQADFEQLDYCADAPSIRLIDRSTFTAQPFSGDTLAFWLWTYQGQTLPGNRQNAVNLSYSGPGRGIAQLVVSSGLGCSDTLSQEVVMYSRPNLHFLSQGGCQNRNLRLVPDSLGLIPGLDSITALSWNFGDGTQRSPQALSPTRINPETHNYVQAGVYFPSLYLSNRGLCEAWDTLRLVVSPRVDPSQVPYFENFEGSPGAWQQSQDLANPTWQWGVLSKPDLLNTLSTGNKAWATGLSQPYPQDADAWVYGPCFDFSLFRRPMIRLDILADMYSYDGAALQYYDDSLNTWITLGQTNRGIAWYNSSAIFGLCGFDPQLPCNPAQVSLAGWTERIGSRQGSQSARFQTARYRLDELRGKADVQFRIAFGGIDAPNLGNKEGFAFDNIWVGERRQNVLVEYFSNLTKPSMAAENNNLYGLIYNQVNGLDVHLAQYHTQRSGLDPINAENVPDHNARTFFYGAEDGEVVVDGRAYSGSIAGMSQATLDSLMLQDPAFNIQVEPLNIINNRAEIEVNVQATRDLPRRTYVLYAMILQDSLFTSGIHNRAVMRKILPEHGFPRYDQAFGSLQRIDYAPDWVIPNGLIDRNLNQMYALVFVQDEDSKEVYQVSSSRNINFATLPTGISPSEPEQSSKTPSLFALRLYPNPTSSAFTADWPEAQDETLHWQLFDLLGRPLQNGQIQAGETQVQIGLDLYPPGMYIFRLHNADGSIVIQRQVIRS